MNPRTVVLILAAVLVAGSTAFLARGWLSAQKAPPPVVQAPPVPATQVLVAKTNLPAGLFIREEHLRWQAWPSDSVPPTYMVQGKHSTETLIGAVVRRGIAAGEPIIATQIAKPGDRGFLAVVLKPGMRAVTIGISEVSGIAGLIFPGDRVDVILTHEVAGAGKASETVLENVRLLAIGQRINDQDNKPISAKTATLELTPKQVEIIAVVAELGRLSLSLRSLAVAELQEQAPVLTASTPTASDADPLEGLNALGAPVDEEVDPELGQTFTLTHEASPLLRERASPGGGKIRRIKVLVMQGGGRQVIEFKEPVQ